VPLLCGSRGMTQFVCWAVVGTGSEPRAELFLVLSSTFHETREYVKENAWGTDAICCLRPS